MPETKKQEATETSNAFTRLLAEFRDGATISELSDGLQQVVAAVKDTGRPGKIIFTLKIQQSGNAMVVTDDITVKAPKLDREKAVFFATDQNTLQRDNPRQRVFELRTVEKPEVEVRNLSELKAEAAVAASQ